MTLNKGEHWLSLPYESVVFNFHVIPVSRQLLLLSTIIIFIYVSTLKFAVTISRYILLVSPIKRMFFKVLGTEHSIPVWLYIHHFVFCFLRKSETFFHLIHFWSSYILQQEFGTKLVPYNWIKLFIKQYSYIVFDAIFAVDTQLLHKQLDYFSQLVSTFV